MRWWDRDTWLELLAVFVENPFRTFLSGLGVGWGVFMILITVGASNGLQAGVASDLGRYIRNGMYLWTQSTSLPYDGYQRGRWLEMTVDDADYLRANSSTMEVVAPRNQLGGWNGANNVTRGIRTGAFNVYGDVPEFIAIEPLIIREGRYLNQSDLDQYRKVAVIGERVAELLFAPDEQVIGGQIDISGVYFTVIGVYGSPLTGDDADESEQSIFTPFTTFNRAFHFGEQIGWLSLMFKEEVHADSAAAEVISLLKERLHVHPDDQRAFGHWTTADDFEEMEMVFGAFRVVAFVFGGLALFAGAIGIVNIMLITVKERTQELGVRRALGATPGTVVRQIISETLFLTAISGLTGMIFGVATLEALNWFLRDMQDSGSFRNPEVSLNVVLQSLAVLLVMGVFAGILPALRAVAIRPVEAIRTE
jgi:putative ABC transport system permease protein